MASKVSGETLREAINNVLKVGTSIRFEIRLSHCWFFPQV